MRLSYIREDYIIINRIRVSCLSKIYIRESFINKGYIKRISYLS
jgi:hypothetical protein